MTKWTTREDRAFARCQGYDLEARWGTGLDYSRIRAETPRKENPKQPGNEEQGIIVRVRSPHRGVDNLQMIAMAGNGNPQDAIQAFTQGNDPESLLPTYDDWMDEWSWIARLQGKPQWKTRDNRATAFLGHLTVVLRMSTLGEAQGRTLETMEPGHLYGISSNIREQTPGNPDGTPVLVAEIHEDLAVIMTRITRTQDEGTANLKEYARKNPPEMVAAACIALAYREMDRGEEEHQQRSASP